MNAQPNDSQPEEMKPPEPSAPEQPAPALQPDIEPAPGKPVKPELSRMRHFWRTSLIWLVVVAIAFLAGVLTFRFLRYLPLTDALNQTQAELTQANQTLSDQQTKIDSLNAQLSTSAANANALESDKQLLQSELDDATAHLELLRVLVDISNARFALINGDVLAAKTALQDAPQLLESLAPRILTVDANLSKSMPQRLTLILAGMDSDVETAKVDLELLTKNLLDVEVLLFGK